MKRKYLVLLLLVTGCSHVDITTDYDDSVLFENYENYSFCIEDLDVTDPVHPDYDNPANRSLIQTAIQNELEAVGLRYEEQDPELQAGFRIVIKDTSITVRNCTTRGEYVYWPECTFQTYNYTQGTLVIYVTDSRKQQVIWQSSASGVLNGSTRNAKKIIDKTVKEMFKEFPLTNRVQSPLI